MNIEINIHVHQHSAALEVKVDKILHQQEKIMATGQEMLAELVEINTATNEIAADIDALIVRVGEGGLSASEAEEIKTQLNSLKSRLTGIASVYTA